MGLRSGVIGIALLAAQGALAQDGADNGEWRHYGADPGSTKYSPLDQITPENVSGLEVAWQWPSPDAAIQAENDRLRRATYFQCTPLAIGGVLYGSTCLSQAFAVDAATGETKWVFNPEAYKAGRPPNLGYISRGVAYTEVDGRGRVFLAASNSFLWALDAKTGEPVASFGEDGKADLIEGVRGAVRGWGYGHPSAPVICRGVVIVGSSITDGPTHKEWPPGVVKGFDAKTGDLKWTFNIIPDEGEFGAETWEDGANRYTGHGNVWTSMSADEELGYVYVPASTPTNDFYGGHRRGANLFAESLVCLDAETGERVWHYQIVHHGLWDYDLPCAPNLVDITVDGQRIKAVAQLTKQGFTFVFDRVTGEPVWPIEERPVPQSTVPGEQTSPTQPFPAKPAPFERQGVHEEHLIDFIPELYDEALAILKEYYNYGPLYTPPSLEKPTLMIPGYGGGANWPGAAVDPETGIIYVPSMLSPSVVQLNQPDPNRSNFRYTRGRAELKGPQGLPLFKPPYGRITAIDLNTGEHLWMKTNGGDGPRDHPAIKHLDLPPLGSNARAATMVTKTLLFATEGSGRSGSATGGGVKLRAFDKATGAVLAEFELPGQITGVPMTYLGNNRQYVCVAVGSTPAQLVALALP